MSYIHFSLKSYRDGTVSPEVASSLAHCCLVPVCGLRSLSV